MSRPKILDHRGNPIRSLDRGAPQHPRLGARYDSAQESADTRNWWANADNLSARAANSPEVREKLRKRARYEVANGSYPAAIARTLAYDLIGTGPRLQVMTDDDGFNTEIEALWHDWAKAIRLPEKLRTMRRARAVDGESFGQMETNRRLSTPSKLDLRVIEAEQVCDPFGVTPDPISVDGIKLDRYGNPASYYVLREHPGDDYRSTGGVAYTEVPARLMIHWFRPDRPNQYRGVPEFTPALDLFAKLRRYTMAVLAAAELVANFSVLLESGLDPDSDEADEDASTAQSVSPFTSTEITRGMMTTLPDGYKMAQPKAEQPTTTYEMFEIRILKQVCVALGIPYFVATGDYADVNFSSGRLGKEGYYRDIDVERGHISDIGADFLFAAWLEDMQARGAVSDRIGIVKRRWLWPGFPYFDPKTEADAVATQLWNGLTTFTDQCHAQGVDPEERAKTMASDVKLLAKYGLPNPYQKPSANVQQAQPAAPKAAYSPSSNGRH